MRRALALLTTISWMACAVARADTPPVYYGRWGGMGTADGQFNVPRGIGVDPWGPVFVADYNNQRVQKFEPLGSFVTAWGSFGSDTSQFNGVWDIAFSKAGNLYVVEGGQSRLQEFTRNGFFIRQWGGFGTGIGQFQTPTGIAIGPNLGVYVCERVGNRIQEFDLNGGFIRSWGSQGLGDGQFLAPRGIAVGLDGSVYVADWFNDRIQKFDSTGAFVAKWDWSSIGTPNYIAVDPQGNLLVTNPPGHNVVKLDTNGNVLTSFGSSGNAPGQFDTPEKVAVSAAGFIYVSDSVLNFVSLFVPATVDAARSPGEFAVYGSVPQPMTSQADIGFALPHAAPVTVGIYDITGRLVRELCRDRCESAGEHEVAWDRSDDHGRRVPAGVYQVLVRSGSFARANKVTVLP